jgi:hypothetical protein
MVIVVNKVGNSQVLYVLSLKNLAYNTTIS